MSYEDFDLHIWADGDRYAAEVSKSPMGPSERVHLSWPFHEERERLMLKLENAVLKSRNSRSGPIPSPEERILREFGADLFKAVFCDSGSVATTYAGSLARLRESDDVGLRINLRADPVEIASLPWEYVFDERLGAKNFLCLRSRSPVVRRLGASPYSTSWHSNSSSGRSKSFSKGVSACSKRRSVDVPPSRNGNSLPPSICCITHGSTASAR